MSFNAPPPTHMIRSVILNATSGLVIGVLFGAIMLLTDTGGIFTLIQRGDNPVFAMVIFMGGCITTFVPLVIATGFMFSDFGQRD